MTNKFKNIIDDVSYRMMYTQFSKFTFKTLKMARKAVRVNSYIFGDYLGIYICNWPL